MDNTGDIKLNSRESLLGGTSLDIIDLDYILLKDFKWHLIDKNNFGRNIITFFKLSFK